MYNHHIQNINIFDEKLEQQNFACALYVKGAEMSLAGLPTLEMTDAHSVGALEEWPMCVPM